MTDLCPGLNNRQPPTSGQNGDLQLCSHALCTYIRTCGRLGRLMELRNVKVAKNKTSSFRVGRVNISLLPPVHGTFLECTNTSFART